MEFQSTLKNFTDVALCQFIRVYEVVKEDKGFEGPEASKLHDWMKNEIFEMEETTDYSRKDIIEIKKENQEKEEAPAAIEEAPAAIEEAPAAIEEAPAAIEEEKPKRIHAKELKKITMQVTKKTKEGEEKVVDQVIELPYLPKCVDYSGCCQALKVNGGLFTPCMTRPSKGSLYCKTCVKEKLKYGTIEDRSKPHYGVKYTDKQGKQEISYGTWLEKRKIERSFVEELITKEFGDSITIPERYYEVNKAKAKRGVKKTVSASSDDEVSSNDDVGAPAEEKKRGRPKKNKEAAEEEEPKKRRGRPAKEAKPVVDESIESNTEEEQQVEAVVEAVVEEKVEEKVEAVVEEKVEAVVEEKVEEKEEDILSDVEDDEEEYPRFHYNGKEYCYDEDNTLILIEDGGAEVSIVGSWDPETQKPVFKDDYTP